MEEDLGTKAFHFRLGVKPRSLHRGVRGKSWSMAGRGDEVGVLSEVGLDSVNVGAKPGQWGGVKAGHLVDRGET